MKIKILLFLVFLSYSVQAQKVVAVIDFEPINLGSGEALALSERFRTEIQSRDTFNVYIDRSSMETVLIEQGFQQTGCTSNECAVEVGEMLGAQEIIVGTVGLIGTTYSVNVRSIAVENGKILKTASRDFKGEIDIVLSPGMQLVADQFISNNQSTVADHSVSRKATADVGDQVDELLADFVPYWEEIQRRTMRPEIYGEGSDVYEIAVRDAKIDIDNEKWVLGPGCAGTGCGTCNPILGFAIVPVTLGWALLGDVHVPARRWRTVTDLEEKDKTTYLKTYKAQVRRTRFQRSLYGAMGGFIAGAVIYGLRK